MRTRRALVTVAFGATLLIGSAVSPASAGATGTFTTKPSQLVDLTGGTLTITPLLTAGDVVGSYQMSGVPDGMGLYRSSPSTVEVYLNHELAFADDDPSDARVSHLTLANDGSVIAADYAVDGSEGYEELCSSTLETIGANHWYFTGEEAPHSPRLGSSFALNADTGRRVETPWFGHLFHENVVPVQGLAQAFVFVSEDGQAGRSQIYAYTAATFRAAIRGRGALTTWVPDGPTDANPSPDDIAGGETLDGHLARIPQRLNTFPNELEAATQALGAFDFVRIEDAVADPAHPGVVYFSDTGAANQQTFRGRVYRLTVDPAHPRHASLEVVLDGDAGDDLFNPDNLGISDAALVIQEDRNYAHSGYNRVLVYDLTSGSLTPVARTDPRPIAIRRAGGPGAWESSGVVDASAEFGSGWWLMDVQAGDISVGVPGPSLEPDSAEGEGGQLLLVNIPGT